MIIMQERKIIFSGFLFLFIFLTFQGFPQVVSGFVYEKPDGNTRSPLPGVTLQWIKTTKGTVTDNAGKFQLSAKGISDERIVVRFLGYRQDTLKLAATDTVLEILMVPAKTTLPTVLRVG